MITHITTLALTRISHLVALYEGLTLEDLRTIVSEGAHSLVNDPQYKDHSLDHLVDLLVDKVSALIEQSHQHVA